MNIVLRNTQQLLGDRLMFTPVVRDLKNSYPDWHIGVISAGPEIWQNNPHIENVIKADQIYDIGPAKVTRGSKTNGLHITTAFRLSLEENLGKPIKQGPFKPDLHLSETEKAQRLIDGPYWVINIDCGPFSAKRWPAERFQAVVDKMRHLTFVQVGLSRDNRYRLQGDNVIDLIDQTSIRQLFVLVYHAHGIIGLISSLMHVAAAFDKPAVILAGAREPPTFERYANHRFLDMVGCLPCCSQQACWKNSLSKCQEFAHHDRDIAPCMDIIPVEAVTNAIQSYYAGGILELPKTSAAVTRRKLIRIISNASCLGGAERSVIEISRLFVENGWRVELASRKKISSELAVRLPPEIVINNHITQSCDLLFLYCSDMVFDFNKDEFAAFGRLQADRKVMAITYKLGNAGQVPWTAGWDKYLFLCSSLRDSFLKKCPEAQTAVLAPAVDLAPFLKVQPDYGGSLRLLRHSSQGSKKIPAGLTSIMEGITTRQPLTEFHFMPFLFDCHTDSQNVFQYGWAYNPHAVAEFLARGNCFWYLLPEGYTDQGPRVIVEAMAAALPVIAENRDGAKDRVTPETGWLIDDHAEVPDLVESLTPEILKTKGRAARDRACSQFQKELWFTEITQVLQYGQ